MKDSPLYVYQLMDALCDIGIRRFMLPDTLGIMNPLQCIEYFRKMIKRYPDAHFDFHAHNDYDLAVSNSLAAVLSGAKGIHVTVNGLGERCGNAPLSSVQVILKDQFHAKTNINENKLNDISRLVESYISLSSATMSSLRSQACMPMVTRKTDSTRTNSCQSASADAVNMPSARTAVRPISPRTSRNSDSN